MRSRSTAATEIYKVLKERILHLEYKPGFALSALTLSEEMNVSRSPAREALIKLASDNLVEIFPQVGSRVSLIDLKKVTEERFLRKSLEESALREFTVNHTEDDIQYMESIIEKQKTAHEKKDFVTFINLDDEFHKRIYTSIGKPRCWALMNNFASNEFRLRLLSCQYVENTTEEVVSGHKTLLDSIRKGDIQHTLDITHHHLSRISAEIPALLEKFPDIFTEGEEKIPYQRSNFLKEQV